MGDRTGMKLYTRSGDDGTTALFGGVRVPKSDARVTAYGSVDELNAVIATVICNCPEPDTAAVLKGIQHDLFVLGAELATPDRKKAITTVQTAQIEHLERLIDEVDGECAPLTEFILPGGTPTASALHHARTVCRRAERAATALLNDATIERLPVIYLNRLSDLLFALARRTNQRAGVPDVPWQKPRS